MVWELDVFLLSIGLFYISGTDALRMKGTLWKHVISKKFGRKKEGGVLGK